MTGQFILADVTSHRRGFGVQPIIDAAARRAQTNQNIKKIIWLVPSHLTAAFNAAHGIGQNSEIRNCDIIGPPLWALIQKEIESITAITPGVQITVVTWDQFIYAEAGHYGRGIIAEKCVEWLADSSVPRLGGPSIPPPRHLPQLGVALPSI